MVVGVLVGVGGCVRAGKRLKLERAKSKRVVSGGKGGKRLFSTDFHPITITHLNYLDSEALSAVPSVTFFGLCGECTFYFF